MTRRHNRLGRGAWVALFALWLQALLPLVHHPAGMAMMGVAPMDMSSMDMSAMVMSSGDMTPVSFGDPRNICLTPGTAPADPSDQAPGHKPPPPCPICQTFQMLHGGFIQPVQTTLVLPAVYRTAVAVPISADVPRQPIHSGARARAPPVSA